MSEAEFHPIADETLEDIMDSIEDAFEDAGLENYEANYAVGSSIVWFIKINIFVSLMSTGRCAHTISGAWARDLCAEQTKPKSTNLVVLAH